MPPCAPPCAGGRTRVPAAARPARRGLIRTPGPRARPRGVAGGSAGAGTRRPRRRGTRPWPGPHTGHPRATCPVRGEREQGRQAARDDPPQQRVRAPDAGSGACGAVARSGPRARDAARMVRGPRARLPCACARGPRGPWRRRRPGAPWVRARWLLPGGDVTVGRRAAGRTDTGRARRRHPRGAQVSCSGHRALRCAACSCMLPATPRASRVRGVTCGMPKPGQERSDAVPLG